MERYAATTGLKEVDLKFFLGIYLRQLMRSDDCSRTHNIRQCSYRVTDFAKSEATTRKKRCPSVRSTQSVSASSLSSPLPL